MICPIVEVQPDGAFRLFRDWAFRLPNGKTIHIIRGFVTDFASIPRLFRSVVSKVGLHSYAAIVHDFIYEYGYLRSSDAKTPIIYFTRAEADDLFREIMKESGVFALRRWHMWLAVRVGGWSGWKRNENEK